MSSQALTFSVAFSSDWHVGTGRGRVGGIDAAVRRDEDGLPFLPAKSLTGLLRDSAEVAAGALDGGEAGSWAAWVRCLFGTQTSDSEAAPARLSVRPAKLSGTLRAVLLRETRLQDRLTGVTPGLRIDPATGRAADGMLRFVERASAGLVLSAEALVDLSGLDDSQSTVALDLLSVAAGLVTAAGGDRRRGAGRCRVSLRVNDAVRDPRTALEHLPDSPPDAPLLAVAPLPLRMVAEVPVAAEATDLELEIRTVTPMLATSRNAGNVLEGEPFVPGRLLAPAVLAALGHPPVLSAAFRAGHVVFTDATPMIAGRRSFPPPRVLAGPKSGDLGGGEELVNTLLDAALPGTRPVRRGFCFLDGPAIRYTIPRREVISHGVIDDEVQRPTEDVGGLYTVDALSAGVSLVARVSGPSSVIDAARHELAGARLRIGRSNKDDYGLVEVVAARDAQPASPPAVSGDFVVWLLSNLLLRDERLRPTNSPSVLASALSSALGVVISAAEIVGSAGVGRHEGWRVRWGAPAPTTAGMAAGTVLRFVAEGTADPARVDAVHRWGLGDRRGEGYGQMRLQHPSLATERSLEVSVPKPESSVPAAAPLDDGDRRLLSHLASAWLRTECERRAAASRGELADRLLPRVTSSQLGRLRRACLALTGPDLAAAERGIRRVLEGWPPAGVAELVGQWSGVYVVLGIDTSEESPWWREAYERAAPSAVQAVIVAAVQHRQAAREMT